MVFLSLSRESPRIHRNFSLVEYRYFHWSINDTRNSIQRASRAKVHNSLPGCAFGLVAIASTRAWIISVSHTTRLCNVIGFRRYNRVHGWDIGFPNCARTATVILNLSSPLSLLYLSFSLSLFSFPSLPLSLVVLFLNRSILSGLWIRIEPCTHTGYHERA